MSKPKIGNCSSVGIIYRRCQPGHVFIETKTPGYPRKVFIGKGLLLGGNWVGKVQDHTPLETFQRETGEELSFGNPALDPTELEILFGTGTVDHPTEKREVFIELGDEIDLNKVVKMIQTSAIPFGAFIQTISRSIFDTVDLENKAEDYVGLVSVFEVPLDDPTWFTLIRLQNKYGNLSNESQSTATSIWRILSGNFQIGWGQDRILAQHFLRHGIDEAMKMNFMPYLNTKYWGPVADDYRTYLQSFEIEKIPEGVIRPE